MLHRDNVTVVEWSFSDLRRRMKRKKKTERGKRKNTTSFMSECRVCDCLEIIDRAEKVSLGNVDC